MSWCIVLFDGLNNLYDKKNQHSHKMQFGWESAVTCLMAMRRMLECVYAMHVFGVINTDIKKVFVCA